MPSNQNKHAGEVCGFFSEFFTPLSISFYVTLPSEYFCDRLRDSRLLSAHETDSPILQCTAMEIDDNPVPESSTSASSHMSNSNVSPSIIHPRVQPQIIHFLWLAAKPSSGRKVRARTTHGITFLLISVLGMDLLRQTEPTEGYAWGWAPGVTWALRAGSFCFCQFGSTPQPSLQLLSDDRL